MATVHSNTANLTFFEKMFTWVINCVQKQIVSRRASIRAPAHLLRPGPKASEEFQIKLQEYGLEENDLWWGPMVLFQRKSEYILQQIEFRKPKHVLDVGSGTSTILLAAMSEKLGFKVTSLENLPGTVSYLADFVNQRNIGSHLTIHQCGFKSYNYPSGDSYRWYNIDLSKNADVFDFVIIDGPMGSIVGRNGAIPQIAEYLAEDHLIILDDSQRDHEKACLAEWKKYFRNIEVEYPEECFGVARIRLLRANNSE